MLKIAVCDDDVFIVQDICARIEGFFNSKHISLSLSRYFSGESLLLDMIGKNTYYDAVFLDIGMDGRNGMETAKQLRKSGINAFIIFITGLKEYVFDAFEVNATNYLLKPIDSHKLHKTLDKISKSTESLCDRFLVINKNRQITKINHNAIIYCEVLNHRVFVYETKNQHEYPAKIDILEKELSHGGFSQGFFRCHRSFIVNLKHVSGYRDGFAIMSSGEKIPVATRRHNDFMKALLLIGRDEVR